MTEVKLTEAQWNALHITAGFIGFRPKRGYRAMQRRLADRGLLEIDSVTGSGPLYRLTPAGRAPLEKEEPR